MMCPLRSKDDAEDARDKLQLSHGAVETFEGHVCTSSQMVALDLARSPGG